MNNNSNSWFINNDNYIVYQPSGLTSLYDVIGESVKKIRNISDKEVLEDKLTVDCCNYN